MSLELILGPMFAGKSTEAMRRIRDLEKENVACCVITSYIDRRYDSTGMSICTHYGDKIPAEGLKNLIGALKLRTFLAATHVFIEEAQFFPDLYTVVKTMVETHKKKVFVFGLDGDAERKPFGQVLDLIPLADTYTKLLASCKLCKEPTPAMFTMKRMSTGEGQICIGGEELYLPVCRKHYLDDTS